jgi:two-component response regulator (ARR-A family)
LGFVCSDSSGWRALKLLGLLDEEDKSSSSSSSSSAGFDVSEGVIIYK